MAKFYFEEDIGKIEDAFGKDDAEKIVEYLTKEREKQLEMHKKMESNATEDNGQKTDSLRVAGKNMEKFYISKKEGKGFTDDDMEQNDLRDPESQKAGEDEWDILSRISKIKEKDKQLLEFGKNIDDVIGAFENSEKSKKDFNLMMEKFDALSWYGEVKKAWSQEQVDKVLEIYEDNMNNLDFRVCPDFFTEVLGHGYVNDLVADYFIKRIESGKEISASFLDKIRIWAGENLYAMDSDIVSDFLLVLINNSDKADRSFIGNIFSNFEWDYLEGFVRRFSEELYKNKEDVYKTLKNIEILEYFKHMIDEQYFEKDTVKYNLDAFKQNNNNYFVNFKIGQVLEFYHKTYSMQEKRFCLEAIKNEHDDLKKEMPDILSISDEEIIVLFDEFKESIDAYFLEKENKRRKNIYDNNEIKSANGIEPVIFQFKDYDSKEKEQKRNEFSYSKISNKYGVVYTPEGGVDSFFELKEKAGGDNNTEKIIPSNLNINDVLENEGFKKENTSEEEYKKMVLTYKTLIELPMREKIENEFGIELKNFNIREQVQFVNFLSSKTIAEVEEVKEFLNQGKSEEAKNNRIKSFLSLESGQEMGNAENADAVFAKYAEIINLAEKNKEELEVLLRNKKGISDKEKEKITQNLISKANQVLVDFSNKIDKHVKIDKCKVLEELKDIKENMVLTASVYKGIDKDNEIKFEDLKGVTFEKKTADDLSGEEIGQMMKIYAKNYEYNPKFQKAILENFENILKNLKEKTALYLFKEDNEVMAFNRFDDMGDGRKYFGSFNVKPIMSGSEIGKALMRVSLEKEAEENEIEADCIPETKISSLYISGNCGFVAKKINPDYKKTGVALFNIERKKENKKYRYHNYSGEEIISEYASGNPENKYSANLDHFILKFNPRSRDLVSISEKLMNEQKYVISNYIFSKDGKEVYCAFEKAV